MEFKTTYLNRSPSKTLRGLTGFRPEFVVMHETGGYGSLAWCLRPEVRASFNYLITRAGTIHHYIDERKYIAWHAGIQSRWTLTGRIYIGGEINVCAIGVEIEGPNDGTPITKVQTTRAAHLMVHFHDVYGIPIDTPYFPEHKDVAPGYKSDGQGFDVRLILKDALTMRKPAARYRVVVDNSNCREGPSTHFPIALGGQAVYGIGHEFDGDTVTDGQALGGRRGWVHRADGIGFLHESLVQRV